MLPTNYKAPPIQVTPGFIAGYKPDDDDGPLSPELDKLRTISKKIDLLAYSPLVQRPISTIAGGIITGGAVILLLAFGLSTLMRGCNNLEDSQGRKVFGR